MTSIVQYLRCLKKLDELRQQIPIPGIKVSPVKKALPLHKEETPKKSGVVEHIFSADYRCYLMIPH